VKSWIAFCSASMREAARAASVVAIFFPFVGGWIEGL
jgi:hypothetical protein